MGLDMYLTMVDEHGERVERGYWRKANAIHNYFVTNVQDGVDDQEEYEVDRYNLEVLLDKCRKVVGKAMEKGFKIADEGDSQALYDYKADKELAEFCEKVLPSCDGFFFGTTDYDYWYFDNAQRTIDLLDGILDDWDTDGHKAYYYSCWW